MSGQLQCVLDYENYSTRLLTKPIYDYYKGGSAQEETLNSNRAAFKKWRIIPRVLKPVSDPRDMQVSVLGEKFQLPFGVAPVGNQKMANHGGECATAKAAADLGMLFILASISNTEMEEVVQTVPHGIKWFQTFIYKDRALTLELIRRAEAAGFKAIVLTVDCIVPGIKLKDKRNNFALPNHLRIVHVDWNKIDNTIASDGDPQVIISYGKNLLNAGQSWEDVAWIKRQTELPIILKGILTPEDAEIAVQHGISAIIVSNHGGRQLDGVSSTLSALPAIVKQVNGRCEVYMDSGITQGTDIFKALALGAKMVFIGRPVIWGLAKNGEDGVKEIVGILQRELDTAMALTGCSSVADIKRELVGHRDVYANL